MSDLLLDLRYAFRSLIRRPGFTAVAVATLALGIGANTALFSAVHALLLTPPPFAEPERLVLVTETVDGGEETPVAVPNFLDLEREARSFEALAAYSGIGFNLSGGDRPERVNGALATLDLFDTLGVELLVGRGFPPEAAWDGVAGAETGAAVEGAVQGAPPPAPAVAVLGRSLWERRFAADPEVVGRTVRLDDRPFTVVGVLRQDPKLPWMDTTDVWVPLSLWRARFDDRGNHSNTALVGRLAPGVTLQGAQQETAAVFSRLAELYPGTNKERSARVQGLGDRLVRDFRPAMLVLWGAVGFVLLIACANLANLMLNRTLGRRRELAVRRALGAGRGRLVRQLVTESVVVGVAGGLVGLLLAAWGLELLRHLLGDGPRAAAMALDLPVLLFALGLAVGTGLAIGVLPAFLVSRHGGSSGLAEGGRGGGPDRGGRRLRQVLVAAEVALAVVLLVGAGLMMESFRRLMDVEPGFRVERLLVADVLLPTGSYGPEQRVAFFESLLERLDGHPEVEAATVAGPLPLSNSTSASSFDVEGQPTQPGDSPSFRYSSVTPGYFEMMEIGLDAGRSLRRSDGPTAPGVVVVDRVLAQRVWPGEDAVGKRLRPTSQDEWLTVVGVVAPVHHLDLDRPPEPHLYFPLAQWPRYQASLVVATRGEPLALADLVRDEVAALDPNLAVGEIVTLLDNRRGNVEEYWYPMLLLGTFALLALALAALGIYGVMAYGVAQRTREIGVRMALGSGRNRVLGMVLGEGLGLAAVGAVVGLAGGLALGRVMESLLYEVRPDDPLSLGVVLVVLIAVAGAACLFPARRAASIDPMEALRWE